jgi:hypothetical protein
MSIQIHHHAYNLAGIYFEKTGYKHKGTSCILHNRREPTTMVSYLNVYLT